MSQLEYRNMSLGRYVPATEHKRGEFPAQEFSAEFLVGGAWVQAKGIKFLRDGGVFGVAVTEETHSVCKTEWGTVEPLSGFYRLEMYEQVGWVVDLFVHTESDSLVAEMVRLEAEEDQFLAHPEWAEKARRW